MHRSNKSIRLLFQSAFNHKTMHWFLVSRFSVSIVPLALFRQSLFKTRVYACDKKSRVLINEIMDILSRGMLHVEAGC